MTAADKIAEALLPCPFCGCPDVVIFQDHAGNTGSAELSGYYISHPLWREYPETWGCQAIPSTAYFATRSEAAAAWNRRAAAAPAADKIAHARALADLADAQAQEIAKLRSALQSASAALNPICGHVKTGQVKRDRYLAEVRAKIAAALGEAP